MAAMRPGAFLGGLVPGVCLWLGNLYQPVLLLFDCLCSVSLPHGAMSWCVICVIVTCIHFFSLYTGPFTLKEHLISGL